MSKGIREKSDYILNLIQKQKGLYRTDELAYKYLYDITWFILKRKINPSKLGSETPEEIVQNIIAQLTYKFSIDNPKNNPNVQSILPYISKCVLTELSKLHRNKYQGQSFIQSGFNLDLDFDSTGEFSYDHTYEVETLINMEMEIKEIINNTTTMLREYPIAVKNKHLLLFPLLLSIAREQEKIINKFRFRIRLALKQIYNEIGHPSETLV